jgi:uncharacterized membrane protein
LNGSPHRPARREEAGVPPALRGIVSRLLIGGLAIATVFFVLGVLGYLAQGIGLGSPMTATGLPTPFPSALAHGDPGAFIFLGLIVLVATPIARVVVSAGLFASSGDRAFTGLTLFVLTVLLATILVGVIG